MLREHEESHVLLLLYALVVRKVDNSIQRINRYPVNSIVSLTLICWIVIYPVDRLSTFPTTGLGVYSICTCPVNQKKHNNNNKNEWIIVEQNTTIIDCTNLMSYVSNLCRVRKVKRARLQTMKLSWVTLTAL